MAASVRRSPLDRGTRWTRDLDYGRVDRYWLRWGFLLRFRLLAKLLGCLFPETEEIGRPLSGIEQVSETAGFGAEGTA